MKRQLLAISVALALVVASCSTMESTKSVAMSDSKTTMAKDGVFLKGGKVMETKGGMTSDLMMDVVLADGTKVMTDGTVMMKDGSKSMLKEGEFYDLQGMKSMVPPAM